LKNIHTFDNGVRVNNAHLTQKQRSRYLHTNLHEPEEEGLFISAVHRLPSGGCFVSVGTAIGYYAVLAKKLRPDLEIHCFDPLPYHLECLKENIHLNGFQESSFHIHQAAVSDRIGKVRFLENSFASSIDNSTIAQRIIRRMRYLFSGNNLNQSLNRAFQVHSVTLSGVFGMVAQQKIGLLQMDIQGHELNVLTEFFKGREHCEVSEFIVGTHGSTIHSGCRNLLLSNGYLIIADLPTCEGQPDGILDCCLKN
jgi:FkbM family methyltransferase